MLIYEVALIISLIVENTINVVGDGYCGHFFLVKSFKAIP